MFPFQVACQGNDPILTGFDGRTFHFDELGEYVILESGDGYKASRLATARTWQRKGAPGFRGCAVQLIASSACFPPGNL